MSMKNILVNWKDLQRGDLIKYKGKKHLVIGFNLGHTLCKSYSPIIYCHRMLFGKYRIGEIVKIIIGKDPNWFEVVN